MSQINFRRLGWGMFGMSALTFAVYCVMVFACRADALAAAILSVAALAWPAILVGKWATR